MSNSEIMCLAVAITTIYIFFAISYLKNGTSIIYPGLAFAIGFWTHLSFGWFGPSLIYLILKGDRIANLLKVGGIFGIFTVILLSLIQSDLYKTFKVSIWQLGYGNLRGGGIARCGSHYPALFPQSLKDTLCVQCLIYMI